jgi:hypothetical protein
MKITRVAEEIGSCEKRRREKAYRSQRGVLMFS